VALGRLKGERFIVYSREDYPEYYDGLKALLRPFGFEPRIGEEYDGVTGLIAAVEAGQGIAIVPSSLACMTGQRLRLLALTPKAPTFIVGAAMPEKTSKLARDFVTAAREAAKEK
jgi:DNA-binding transcriptional LysR family regulator